MLDTTALVAQIRRHAEANYEKDGWDFLVECYSDEDIAREIGKASTLRGAIWKLRQGLTLHNDRRSEIEATIF